MASPAPLKIDRAAAKKRIDDAEEIPVFEIDDVTYSVKNVPRSEVALRYLDIATNQGDDAGNYYILTETMGQGAYDALKGVDGLSDEDFQAVIERVQAIVTPASNPKGRRG
jgi:hypothetical protein